MKLLTIGYEGIEEVMKGEVEELLNAKVKSKTESSVLIFDVHNKDVDLKTYTKLAYLGQSFSYIMEFLGSFEIKEFEDIEKAKDFDYSKLKDKKFRVTCLRVGHQSFSSKDIEPRLGELILEKAKDEKISASVDLEQPEIEVFVYIYKNNCYVGLNYTILDLGKRDYKVYQHPKSLKGNLAYSLVKLSGYESNKVLLDPFSHSGEIAIEAAFLKSKVPINLHRKEKFGPLIDKKFLEEIDAEMEKGRKKTTVGDRSIFAFDSDLRNIKATKQNAIIGGVKDQLEISKTDAEWIDVKMDKHSVDLIVTNPDLPGRANKDIKKKYEEFFYNSEYILKKGGKIYAISNEVLRETAEKKDFNLEKTILIKKGEREIEVDVYVPNKD